MAAAAAAAPCQSRVSLIDGSLTGTKDPWFEDDDRYRRTIASFLDWWIVDRDQGSVVRGWRSISADYREFSWLMDRWQGPRIRGLRMTLDIGGLSRVFLIDGSLIGTKDQRWQDDYRYLVPLAKRRQRAFMCYHWQLLYVAFSGVWCDRPIRCTSTNCFVRHPKKVISDASIPDD